MERDFGFACGERDLTAFLPMPFRTLGPKFGGERLAVDDELEAAGGARGVPVANPILGADPNAVFAGARNLRVALGVSDGLAEAVSQQVGRADDVREGGIQFPATMGGE